MKFGKRVEEKIDKRLLHGCLSGKSLAQTRNREREQTEHVLGTLA